MEVNSRVTRDGNGAIPDGDRQNVLAPEKAKCPRSPPRHRLRGRNFSRPRPRTGIMYPTGPRNRQIPKELEHMRRKKTFTGRQW